MAICKLPADFTHLDYVNPDAPKGGEISQWAFGTFDSLNPYSIKGVPAAGSDHHAESILTGTADEIGASLLPDVHDDGIPRRPVLGDLQPAP